MSDIVLSTYIVSQHLLEVSTIVLSRLSDSILSSLKKNELRLMEDKSLTQGHTDSKGWKQD